jgi:hypothetical protein
MAFILLLQIWHPWWVYFIENKKIEKACILFAKSITPNGVILLRQAFVANILFTVRFIVAFRCYEPVQEPKIHVVSFPQKRGSRSFLHVVFLDFLQLLVLGQTLTT